MQRLKPYSYVILQYCPDLITGEVLNVGVVLYSADDCFLGVRVKHSIARISQAFPGIYGQGLKRIIGWIRSSIERHASQLLRRQANLFHDEPRSAEEFALLHFPNDDSSLRWSSQRYGLSDNPASEIERIYKRVVAQYDRPIDRSARSDADVWWEYSKALDNVGLASELREHTVKGDIEPYKFNHALKNGIWHCFEPLSFDLIRPESIKTKARDKFAEMSFIRAPTKALKVYFLIGESQSDEGRSATETAIKILERSPLEKEIIREGGAPQLASRLAAAMH